MEMTYQSIQHLVKETKVENQMLTVFFQDEKMPTPIQGYAPIVPDQQQMTKNITKNAVKMGLLTAALSWVSRLLGRRIGGTTGSIVSSTVTGVGSTVAYSQMNKSGGVMNVELNEENKKEYVLKAFQSLQAYFQWNEAEKKWEGKSMATNAPS